MNAAFEGSDEPGDRLRQALRQARLAEAAHLDAILDLQSAEALRLQVLKDDLAAIVGGRPETSDIIDLALVPGPPPRLWIDMVSYVLMAPDPRTYRFQQDVPSGHEILLETTDRQAVVEAVTAYVAHRLIERQRALGAPATAGDRLRQTSSTGALVLAWLCGFALGVLALLIAGMWFLSPGR